MIVFCHKWLHQFDQENNYKIKIVRRACVFCDRVDYCSLERLSFALRSSLTPLYLPSIYNCSIKIITLLPIGWILFHRSYRIKFYHFIFVSFVSPVFPVFLSEALVLHLSRQEMGECGQICFDLDQVTKMASFCGAP